MFVEQVDHFSENEGWTTHFDFYANPTHTDCLGVKDKNQAVKEGRQRGRPCMKRVGWSRAETGPGHGTKVLDE